MADTHFHPLRVKAVRPDTEEAMIVTFDVPEGLERDFCFTQGQYLTLRSRIDGEDVRRSYSICAGLDDGELRVGVRRVQGGRFSNWLAQHLRAGDLLDVMPPQGRFFVALDAAQARHYLGVAGGSGITPVLSIMKTVLAREPRSRFTLVYGNRRSASTMFKEELEDLKNRYVTRLALHHVFSEERMDSPLHQGLLDRAKLAEFLDGLVSVPAIDHAFVCGPYTMNDEAEAALLAAGMPAERVHIERFGVPVPAGSAASAGLVPAQHVEPGDAAQCRVTVIRDGITQEIGYRESDGNLLEAAASAGLDVPYSCKSGVCGTCRAHLAVGQVRMARNFALEKSDLAAGFVLTCQAHPLTPEVTLDFDHR
ncbi:MAG TPA: 1,2-phenylacetyl-CoA epoxidase subunit PaaE [Burkholderiaceae bacterium]|nr:1,2-phenylacetyl-CoA epoxidase subunit PaaE [Burkholderiaceae bacterium]